MKMAINKEFIGKKIKEYRKKKNLSQAELAEITGLSDKHIGRIEAGKYFPNLLNFLNILDVIGLNLADLGLSRADKISSPELSELLDIIYSSSEKEIKLYLKLVKAVRE